MDKVLKNYRERLTYKDIVKRIQENMQNLARDYVAIGYYLRYARDERLFVEDGYASIHEFAHAKFGMKKSTANHCIRINAEFSEGGNSASIDPKYAVFGRSQLQEMLYVPKDERDKVTPEMTVEEIRQIHKPKRLDNEPEKKTEKNAEVPVVKDIPATVRQEPEERSQGRKETSAAQQGVPEVQEIAGEPFVQQHAAEQQKILEGTKKCITGWSRYGVCICCGEGGVSCCDQCEESCNSRCGWIDDPYIPESGADPEEDLDVIDAQYKEEPVVITAQGLLDRKQKELDTWMEAIEQDGDPCIPPWVEELRITVQALELLAGQHHIPKDGEEPQEQPPLPVLKNNEQRKEWLKKYQEWGLWYEDEHIGVKYYRYCFENGAELIVDEYLCNNRYVGDYVTPYFHLVGGPEPQKRNGIDRWQRHEQYSRYPNSESELVEFLKSVQKENTSKAIRKEAKC